MSEWNIDHMRKIAGLGGNSQSAASVLTEGADPTQAVLTAAKVHQLIESVGFTKTKQAIQTAYDSKTISGATGQSFIRILNTARGQENFVLEGWDDDDEDPDVKIANSDKRQSAFEKRNKKEIKAANKDADAKEESKKSEDRKPDPESKQDDSKKEPEAAAKAEEAKRRGKAPNENSFNQQAKKYAKEHTRGSFIKWAAENHGKTKNYASAMFAKYNPKSGREQKVVEAMKVWGIVHPTMAGFTLADNREMNQMQWIDSSSPLDSMIFMSEAEANKVAKYMAEWRSQSAIVESYDFSEE